MSTSGRVKRHIKAAGSKLADAFEPKQLWALYTAANIARPMMPSDERAALDIAKAKLRQAVKWKETHPAVNAAITRKRKAAARKAAAARKRTLRS